MIKDKLANWCKAVLGGRRKSARGVPPQGKIKNNASRTRPSATVYAEPSGPAVSGPWSKISLSPENRQAIEDRFLCPDCGHYTHDPRPCGQPDIVGDFARGTQDLQKAPAHDCDPGPCRCHLGDTEPQDSEEGAITSDASKIFLRYLEGDLEAAKIVEGWARKERDRSSSGRLPLRATEGYGHAPKAEYPSGGVHDDARHVDGRYASGDGQ